MNIAPYQAEFAEEWDRFILRESWNGTFLHTRKFLSYHQERFSDVSVVIFNNDTRCLGVFPCAEKPGDPGTVVSHPGITYGGLISGKHLRGEDCICVLKDLAQYYKNLGYSRLQYKVVPYIYHTQPQNDDIYALFRLGAKLYRVDLSSCIDLENRGDLSKGHKWSINKAKKHKIDIQTGEEFAEAIMSLVNQRLLTKYASSPVHTTDEILLLHHLFPKNIWFAAAIEDGVVVAGAVLFNSGRVAHTQYLAASEKGQNSSALHLLVEQCISLAGQEGRKYFDFGISNEKDGQYLNTGLFQFKTNFGAGSVVHPFYEIDLRNLS